MTKRAYLQQVEKATGKKPEELVPPCNFPDLLEHVWKNFLDLAVARSYTEFGPNPIDYLMIESWSKLTETPISPREVNLIIKLDRVYREVVSNG